ncbi:MAG: hypothetical protein ABUS48_01275 [Pseudomonadota bacterium]
MPADVRFSWNAVALAGLGGGFGALSSMATQGIGVATGLQKSFSWAGVSTSAIFVIC